MIFFMRVYFCFFVFFFYRESFFLLLKSGMLQGGREEGRKGGRKNDGLETKFTKSDTTQVIPTSKHGWLLHRQIHTNTQGGRKWKWRGRHADTQTLTDNI